MLEPDKERAERCQRQDRRPECGANIGADRFRLDCRTGRTHEEVGTRAGCEVNTNDQRHQSWCSR